MKTLVDAFFGWLKNVTANCVIIGAFAFSLMIVSVAMAVCMIWKIEPTPTVMTNAKELVTVLCTAMSTFLAHKGLTAVQQPNADGPVVVNNANPQPNANPPAQ